MAKEPVARSEAFYRSLLSLYPAAFQKRFSAEMTQVFRALCHETYQDSGTSGLALLWAHALLDWARSVIIQWWIRLFKGKGMAMQDETRAITFGAVPLTVLQTVLAVLPFLLYGIASIASRQQVLFTNPYLVFNWLILIGLAAGIITGFARWALSYFGWALIFGLGYSLTGMAWWVFFAVVAIGLLFQRSFQPLRTLAANLWHDLTLIPFGLFILYSWVILMADENHNPYLYLLITASTLAACAGAWGFFRSASPVRRVLSLIGAIAAWIVIGLIDNATWDMRAYYNLPESSNQVNIAGVGMAVVLLGAILGFGYLARWRQKRAHV